MATHKQWQLQKGEHHLISWFAHEHFTLALILGKSCCCRRSNKNSISIRGVNKTNTLHYFNHQRKKLANLWCWLKIPR